VSGGPADDQSGMNAVPPQPSGRGLALLMQHCASLDPDTPRARERLDTVLGEELAQKLVFALCGTGSPDRQRFAA
jgi:hypothetical protein